MLDKLQATLFYPLLNRRKGYSDEELQNYVIMLAVAVIACSVHVLFSVFFLVAGSILLAVSHFFGIFMFVMACLLLEKRHYDPAGMIVAVMILFSSIATIFTIGGDNYSLFYQLLVLLMLLVAPFTNRRLPMVFAGLMPLIMLASYLLDRLHQPLMSIGAANTALTVMNILIVSCGFVLMLSLDRLVRNILGHYKQQQFDELQAQATLDPLTGLYNRRFADAYFQKLCDEGGCANSYLAMIDIDDFKTVNDTYGHEAGDETLRKIAELFISNTRKSDVAFRWGGEEFLLVINDVTQDEAYRLMEKMRQLVAEMAMSHKENTFHITITVGLARLDPQNMTHSLEISDQKLYEGKRGTKNVVIV